MENAYVGPLFKGGYLTVLNTYMYSVLPGAPD